MVRVTSTVKLLCRIPEFSKRLTSAFVFDPKTNNGVIFLVGGVGAAGGFAGRLHEGRRVDNSVRRHPSPGAAGRGGIGRIEMEFKG